MGFRRVLSEEFPRFNIVELTEIKDDRERAYNETTALLKRHLTSPEFTTSELAIRASGKL